MMDQIAALMMLVGCSSGHAACTEIPVPSPIYESVEACKAALPLQMRFSSTYDHRVLGECQPLETADLETPTAVEWAVNRAGQLHIALKPGSNLLAAR